MKPFRIAVALYAVALVAMLCACTRRSAPESDESSAAVSTAPSDTLKLTDTQLGLFTLASDAVTRGELDQTVSAPGRVSFDQNRTAKITSTLEGRIATMHYDVGASVHKGDVMVSIDSPELINRFLELKAPINGEVITRNGSVGEIIDKTLDLYVISDPSHLWVLADVSTNDIGAVHNGQSVSIRAGAGPDATLAGKVILVSPEVNEQSRTVEVRIEPIGASATLKPGAFVETEIRTGSLGRALTVSADAVQRLAGIDVVFVQVDPHTFVKRPVKTGLVHDGRAQVIEGIADGERVVTTGSFILKSELLKNQLGE